jgi:hypothetical protein
MTRLFVWVDKPTGRREGPKDILLVAIVVAIGGGAQSSG